MPQGFNVLQLNQKGRCKQIVPKEDGDRLAVEVRAVGKDYIFFYADFVIVRQSWYFLGFRERKRAFQQ